MSTATAGIVLVFRRTELGAAAAHLAAQVSGGTVTTIAATAAARNVLGVRATSQHLTVSAARPGSRRAHRHPQRDRARNVSLPLHHGSLGKMIF